MLQSNKHYFFYFVYMNNPLSESQLRQHIPNANFVPYDEIYKYKSLDQVLSHSNIAIIVYLFTPTYGHYTTLFRNQNGFLTYFDPFGNPIDKLLNKVPSEYKNELHENHKYLKSLIGDEQVDENKYKLQNEKSQVCGEWCAFRIKNRHLSNEQFKNYIDDLKQTYQMTGDQLVYTQF